MCINKTSNIPYAILHRYFKYLVQSSKYHTLVIHALELMITELFAIMIVEQSYNTPIKLDFKGIHRYSDDKHRPADVQTV